MTFFGAVVGAVDTVTGRVLFAPLIVARSSSEAYCSMLIPLSEARTIAARRRSRWVCETLSWISW